MADGSIEKNKAAGGTDSPAASEKTASKNDPSLINSSVLAFIGDAVYETFARVHVFDKGLLRADRLSSAATGYVRAEAQAYAYDRLQPVLTEKEAGVARRGKNHKITSMPKHVDPAIYKKATGFEALLGYLKLSGDEKRLEEIVRTAMAVIEEKDFSRIKR